MAERKTCANPGCEKKFTAHSNKKLYCSDQCNKKAYYKRNKKKKQDQFTSQMTASLVSIIKIM